MIFALRPPPWRPNRGNGISRLNRGSSDRHGPCIVMTTGQGTGFLKSLERKPRWITFSKLRSEDQVSFLHLYHMHCWTSPTPLSHFLAPVPSPFIRSKSRELTNVIHGRTADFRRNHQTFKSTNFNALYFHHFYTKCLYLKNLTYKWLLLHGMRKNLSQF